MQEDKQENSTTAPLVTEEFRGDQKPRKWVWKGIQIFFFVFLVLFALSFFLTLADYTTRGHVEEGVAMALGYKNAIADYHAKHGQFPYGTSEEIIELLELHPLPDSSSVKKMTPHFAGVIQIEYTDVVESGGKMLFLVPSVDDAGKVIWDCDKGAGDSAIQYNNLPFECRSKS